MKYYNEERIQEKLGYQFPIVFRGLAAEEGVLLLSQIGMSV